MSTPGCVLSGIVRQNETYDEWHSHVLSLGVALECWDRSIYIRNTRVNVIEVRLDWILVHQIGADSCAMIVVSGIFVLDMFCLGCSYLKFFSTST